MSEPENFLERWSKRKLAKDGPALPEHDAGAPQAELDNVAPAPAMETNATNAKPENPVFDPSSLPSIESIGADTDVTAFLRPGVPPELTRAALRRAWTTDPAIRDFVGLVENGWDFNDPHAMHGFGSIDPADAARLFSQAVGQVLTPSGDTKKEPTAPSEERALTDRSAGGGDAHCGANDAPQNKSGS
jgi:hypothetical protein